MNEKAWRIHPAATRELFRAADRYERARPGLAAELLDAFELAYASARRGPLTGTAIRVASFEIHRMLLERFPFAIVIAELETERVILAIAHARRQPRTPRSWRGASPRPAFPAGIRRRAPSMRPRSDPSATRG